MASAKKGQPKSTNVTRQNLTSPRGTTRRPGPPQRQTSAGSAPDAHRISENRPAQRLSSSGGTSRRPASRQTSVSQVDEVEWMTKELTLNGFTDQALHRPFSSSSSILGGAERRSGSDLTPGPRRPPSAQGASNVHRNTGTCTARRSTTGSASAWHELDNEAERIMTELKLKCSSDPRRDTLEFFNTEVQLAKTEKEKVSGSFNTLRNGIIKKLKEETKWDWTFLNAGSSYDGTKVTRPDEYDCMLFPTIPEECLKIRLENAPPGYCFVEFHSRCARSADRDGMDYLMKLCVMKDGVSLVRSDLYREEIHGIIAVAVEETRRAQASSDRNPASPAFPVTLNAIPTDKTLRKVSIDFVPGLHLNKLPRGTGRLALKKEDKEEVKKQGFDVTPKQCNRDRKNQKVLWRLSFSRAEKYLTKFADSGTKTAAQSSVRAAVKEGRSTCRKEVLRVLKRLLELIKRFDNSKHGHKNKVMVSLQKATQKLSQTRHVSIERFTTYEIRMLMLREFHINCQNPEDWTMECRRARLQHALGQLKKMLKGSEVVPHFFLPSVIPDIMADVPQSEREFLYVMFTIAEKLL